ncbi:hypothetical protein JY409_00025 [Stenotrophomonas maltophilia]|uniref:Conjugal transfer protein TraR n=1 Tax=Stenotrophomonas bentonitica TaxID=1450134 RepID=A0ABU9JP56_9GAMM|nr:hypothetical protein [Stenotrophomonas sp. PA-6-5C]MBN4936459.1 hypothetical protein [Stenotrophomonas maltophilia]MCF5088963.1 hypothetical protein [Stenotrophomonas sp. PA-6-5C]
MMANLGITNTPLASLEKALHEQLSKGKTKLEQDFREAYPVLEQHIAKKMRKKILVEQFNAAYKHDLNLIQFRKLLNEERARRHAEGDAARCQSCGHLLVEAEEQTAFGAAEEDA